MGVLKGCQTIYSSLGDSFGNSKPDDIQITLNGCGVADAWWLDRHRDDDCKGIMSSTSLLGAIISVCGGGGFEVVEVAAQNSVAPHANTILQGCEEDARCKVLIGVYACKHNLDGPDCDAVLQGDWCQIHLCIHDSV